jgi:predicted protein tyrosine phosphatase
VKALEPVSFLFRMEIPALELETMLLFQVKSGVLLEEVAAHLKDLFNDLVENVGCDLEPTYEPTCSAEKVTEFQITAAQRLANWKQTLAQAETAKLSESRIKADLSRMREAYFKELQNLRQQLFRKQQASEKGEEFQPDMVCLFNPADFVGQDKETITLLQQQASVYEERFQLHLSSLRERNAELIEQLKAKNIKLNLQAKLVHQKVDECKRERLQQSLADYHRLPEMSPADGTESEPEPLSVLPTTPPEFDKDLASTECVPDVHECEKRTTTNLELLTKDFVNACTQTEAADAVTTLGLSSKIDSAVQTCTESATTSPAKLFFTSTAVPKRVGAFMMNENQNTQPSKDQSQNEDLTAREISDEEFESVAGDFDSSPIGHSFTFSRAVTEPPALMPRSTVIATTEADRNVGPASSVDVEFPLFGSSTATSSVSQLLAKHGIGTGTKTSVECKSPSQPRMTVGSYRPNPRLRSETMRTKLLKPPNTDSTSRPGSSNTRVRVHTAPDSLGSVFDLSSQSLGPSEELGSGSEKEIRSEAVCIKPAFRRKNWQPPSEQMEGLQPPSPVGLPTLHLFQLDPEATTCSPPSTAGKSAVPPTQPRSAEIPATERAARRVSVTKLDVADEAAVVMRVASRRGSASLATSCEPRVAKRS